MNADNLIKLENNLALLYGRESTPTIEKLKPSIEKWKEKIQTRVESWNESDSFLSLMVTHLKGLIVVDFPY